MSTGKLSPEISKPTSPRWSEISSSLAELSWGTGFTSFRFRADSQVIERARQVLEPWLSWNQGPLLGSWSAETMAEGWKLHSPGELAPLLELWNAPDELPSVEYVVKAVEFQATALAVMDPASPLGLHGALVSRGEGDIIAIVGEKEAGKSTLSVALWQAGFRLLSDDGFFFEPDGIAVRPVPRRSRLRPASREFFSASSLTELEQRPTSYLDFDGSLLFRTDLLEGRQELVAVVVLEAEPGELTAMSEADGLIALYRQTYRHHVDGIRTTLKRLAPLANRVPIFKLGRGSLESRVAALRSLPL